MMKRVPQVDQSEGQTSGLEPEGRCYAPKASAHDHHMDISGGDLTPHAVIQ